MEAEPIDGENGCIGIAVTAGIAYADQRIKYGVHVH